MLSPPLRVLIVAESFLPHRNGVTNSVVQSANHLRAEGHEVSIVAPAPGPAHLWCGAASVPIERVRAVPLPWYRELEVGIPGRRQLRRIVDAFAPDVVHLAAPVVLGARAGQVAATLGVPSVAVFQTDLVGFAAEYGFTAASAPLWRWLRGIHSRADRTLAPTPTLARHLRDRGFVDVGVWGRGVDHERFSPVHRNAAVRAAWGADPADVVVGYVGRLAPEKDVGLLVGVAGRPGVRLVVVGDGPDRHRLERALPGAHFTGHLDGSQLGAAFASLDVFVHTGAHETFCQTIQEAMASGVAVAVPDTGGPRDLVAHEHTGLRYRAGDPAALAAAVHRLVVDEPLRNRLVHAGRRQVANRSWQAVGRELEAHYHAVLRRRAASAPKHGSLLGRVREVAA